MKNVLVLEDDAECNQLLCDILSRCREDITIYSASDEKEALQLAVDCYIHLFVLDISLYQKKENDHSGFMFAKQLRRMEQYAITPFMFVTSVANLELHSYREVSCFKYVLKPITPDKQRRLVWDVEALLAGAGGKVGDEFYYFKVNNVYHPVKIADIVSVQCECRRLKIRTTGDLFYVSRLTLKQFVKDLNKIGNNPFVECRRGCLINSEYIENIDLVNRYLKLSVEDKAIDFGNSKWLSRVRGIVHYDK